MDPNEALKNLRYKVERMISFIDSIPEKQRDEYPVKLDNFLTTSSEACDLFCGLDQWLTKGGLLPTDWRTFDPKLGAKND
jgi:hypothetical protein